MAKILELSHVTPFTDDSQEFSVQPELCLPLTFCDTMWFKFPPVERLFLYSLAEPKETLLYSVVPKLKKSLSVTLRHFLPLAGTLTWPPDSPKPVVLYCPPNGSVSLTIAESDADLDSLSVDEPREAASFRGLVPELNISSTGASVISFQITLFPEKGFCVGVTSHHAVLDGKSTTMFVKSWAHVCRDDENPPSSSLPPELMPLFDRSVIRDPKGLDMLFLKQWSELSGSKVSDPREDSKLFEHLPLMKVPTDAVRTTFNLSRTDIAKLRRDVQSSSRNCDELQLSSFVVSFSFMLFCIVEATEERSERVMTGFAADFRSRLRPPVPGNYFGNCVGPAIGPHEVRQLVREKKEDGGGRALTAVVEMVSGIVRGLEGSEVMEGAEEWLTLMSSVGPARAIGVAGSPRFGVYSVDFGWGRPQKVEIVSIDRTGAVSMAESRDGSGGVEVSVVLKKHEMEIFTSNFILGLKNH